jgi:hypothetical protein
MNTNNTLDLIIASEHEPNFIHDVSTHPLLFSDHRLVLCQRGIPSLQLPQYQEYEH